MKQFLFFIILGCLLSACSEQNDIPGDVIQPKQMEKIVWDMLLADETALQNKLKDTALNMKAESFRLYDHVFAIHNISREHFYKSYEYYQKHPLLYQSLIKSVKSIAEKERTRNMAPIER